MRVPWPDSLKNSSSTNKEASPCPGFLVVLLPGPITWGHQGKGGEQSFAKGAPYSSLPDLLCLTYPPWTQNEEGIDTMDG